MPREDVFDAWAPTGGAWSLWAKPVLFAQMSFARAAAPAPHAPAGREYLSDASWAPPGDGHTFIVIDLPEADAVYLSVALARRGYQPVPLYNACTADHELVDQSRIQRALVGGVGELRALNLPSSAPPAFLLDELRAIYRDSMPGDFDNRWRVFPEDFPSTELLCARGLERMVLVQRGRPSVPADLWMVMWDWQQAGIEMMSKDVLTPPSAPQPFRVPAPSLLRQLWERVLTALGLRRGPARGFGHRVPEASHG